MQELIDAKEAIVNLMSELRDVNEYVLYLSSELKRLAYEKQNELNEQQLQRDNVKRLVLVKKDND